MSHCEEYAALLDAFVDGELSRQEMEQVQVHLDGCQDCREYVDDALAIRAAFPEAEETQVPEGFAQGVLELVAGRPQKASRPAGGRLRVWGAAAACVVLLLQLALYGGGFQGMQGRSADNAAAQETSGGAAAYAALPETAGGEDEEIQSRWAAENKTPYAFNANSSEADSEPVDSPEASIPNAAPAQHEAAMTAEPDGDVSAGGPAGAGKRSLADAFQSIQTSLEQFLQVEIPAGQEDLLTAWEPLMDEAGRVCYLLDGEEYGRLLLALAEREAEIVNAPMLTDAGQEPAFVLVYLAEA